MKHGRLRIYVLVCILIAAAACYWLHLSWWIFVAVLLSYIIILVRGAINIQLNFFINSIHQVGEEKQKVICLTFDDGIHAEYTPQVLNILKRYKIKAVFFLIGKHIHGNEHILKVMHDDGHVIGNHTYSHGKLIDLKSTKDFLEEIEKTSKLIEQTIPYKVQYFRPPYGVTNPHVARAILASGLVSTGWSLRSMDTIAKSKKDLLEKLKTRTKPNDIILLHDRCKNTVEALTEYIEYCLAQGYTFVTLP